MIDLLPWLLILLVLALAIGYVAGRRSRPEVKTKPESQTGINDTSLNKPGTRPSAPASEQSAMRKVPPAQSSKATATAGSTNKSSLAAARSWGYQLQNLNLKRAEASPFDVIVVDYAKDGSDESALKPAEVEQLKSKPDGTRRVVLAYVSIGEAESYRSYWQKGWKRDKPAWLLGENPEWEENYAVCFWEPEWQQLFCGTSSAYIDRIIAQGFDGIYLDKCDVVDDLRQHFKAAAKSRKNLDGDMVAFVQRISTYTKSKRPGFHIVMQNAEQLLEHAELRRAIDAVAKEELLFGLDRPEKANTRDEVTESRDLLDLMKRDGKPVFVVEYLDNQAKISDAAERIKSLGYVLYIAPKDRELDHLNYTTLEA